MTFALPSAVGNRMLLNIRALFSDDGQTISRSPAHETFRLKSMESSSDREATARQQWA